MKKQNIKEESLGFSLAQGGPLYQFYLFTHLAKPPYKHCLRRMLVIMLLTWVPLLLLSALSGTALGEVKVPFVYDIATHVRFLISLNLLIVAEVTSDHYIARIVTQLVKRDIVTKDIQTKFAKIIASSTQILRSGFAEIFFIVLIVLIGNQISKEFFGLNVATWYTNVTQQGPELTLAGYWFAFVSLPIFQFMLLRWYFRLFVWYRFLWCVSRLPLNLNALHPDKAGGIGFLEYSVYAFWPFLLAHSVLIAGTFANLIWYTGATLVEFKLATISIILFLMALILIPLLFFLPSLFRAKINGTATYGITASEYVNRFREKWLSATINSDKSILGTPDIQSLADLSNSYFVSSQMNIVPFNRRTIVKLIIIIVLPLLPLVLTVIPLDEMASSLAKIIL